MLLIKQIRVGFMAVFAYLVGDPESGEALVIDPAANVEGILAQANDNKLRIKYIVNTHGHVDHTSGNREMKKKTEATIVIHADDAVMLEKTPAAILKMFGAKPSPPADITLREGDQVSIGRSGLKVLHTPGHSPGSMALYTDGYVFTGDTLFVGAVGRTDLPGGSWPAMRQSIREKLMTLPEETQVLPGHHYGPTPTSTIGHEKMFNTFTK